MNGIKRIWFQYYWLVALAFAVPLSLILYRNVELIVATGSVVFSIIFFTQKQKLEEIKWFKELFTEFNLRYNDLNDKILDIKNNKEDKEAETRKTLDDYFNLCAEEYLFYKEGRILNLVWGSWCRGMQEHLQNKSIKEYWDNAQEENSYYGLTTAIIEEGAKLKA